MWFLLNRLETYVCRLTQISEIPETATDLRDAANQSMRILTYALVTVWVMLCKVKFELISVLAHVIKFRFYTKTDFLNICIQWTGK